MSVEVRLVKDSRFVDFTPEDGKPGYTHMENDGGLCLVMEDARAGDCVQNLLGEGWEEG
jgi:hypothetical protein